MQSDSETRSSVIVVGAGAAGLTVAIFAARLGLDVTVVDSRAKPGAKIRISGGGRCNVLPSTVSLDDFHTSGSTRAMRNVLFSWPLEDVREFFERDLCIPLKVEATGKLFPTSDRSRDVVDGLMGALRASGARLRTPCRITDIIPRLGGGFTLVAAEGDRLRCRHLVLATGGLSLPKSGSDGAGLSMAAALGHTLVPTYPALVPLLTTDPTWRELSGVSARVRIAVMADTPSLGRDARPLDSGEGQILVTHRGFSGPAVLDMSHHVTRGGDVVLRVHWGGRDVDDWDRVLRAGGAVTVTSSVRRYLPNRLAASLVARAGVSGPARLSELRREPRMRLVEALGRMTLPVSGDEGYATAEVTGGGIPLAEVRPGTLESRVVPSLYVCGEMVDVTGRLGGYNFLWAWVTGYKVARALAAATA